MHRYIQGVTSITKLKLPHIDSTLQVNQLHCNAVNPCLETTAVWSQSHSILATIIQFIFKRQRLNTKFYSTEVQYWAEQAIYVFTNREGGRRKCEGSHKQVSSNLGYTTYKKKKKKSNNATQHLPAENKNPDSCPETWVSLRSNCDFRHKLELCLNESSCGS